MLEVKSQSPEQARRKLLGKWLCWALLFLGKRRQHYDGNWLPARNEYIVQRQQESFAFIAKHPADQKILHSLDRISQLLVQGETSQKTKVSVPSQHYPID